MVAADCQTGIKFLLFSGETQDASAGRELLMQLGDLFGKPHLLMDRAYEGAPTRELAARLGFKPAVPPKKDRKQAWEYDREKYKKGNEIERLFRRIKSFRRVFTRYDKLDVMFAAFVSFSLIVNSLN